MSDRLAPRIARDAKKERKDGSLAARLALRGADASEESGVHGGRDTDPGPGHWSERGDIFPYRSSSIAPSASAETGRACRFALTWTAARTELERWRQGRGVVLSHVQRFTRPQRGFLRPTSPVRHASERFRPRANRTRQRGTCNRKLF